MTPFELSDEYVDTLPSPRLVIDLQRVRHNARTVIDLIGGESQLWRPHLKTTKMPEIWRELTALGIRQFKCATTLEADIALETLGAIDLLCAHPAVGPNLARLGALAKRYRDSSLSVLSETPEHAAIAPEALGIFVDVNPGMNRTGVPLDETERIVATARAAGSRFRGIHAYEGHLHAPALDDRRALAEPIYARLVMLVETLRSAGLEVGEIITSGTPGFVPAVRSEALSALRDIHRVSPGTVVLNDARTQSEVEELSTLRSAALVLARVVSHPAAQRVTCDAGSKALAAEVGDPCAVALNWPGLVAQTPNEEHLPFQVTGETPPRGTPLWLFPVHVCPTVNLANEAVLIDADVPPRVVTIAARGHAS